MANQDSLKSLKSENTESQKLSSLDVDLASTSIWTLLGSHTKREDFGGVMIAFHWSHYRVHPLFSALNPGTW